MSVIHVRGVLDPNVINVGGYEESETKESGG